MIGHLLASYDSIPVYIDLKAGRFIRLFELAFMCHLQFLICVLFFHITAALLIIVNLPCIYCLIFHLFYCLVLLSVFLFLIANFINSVPWTILSLILHLIMATHSNQL